MSDYLIGLWQPYLKKKVSKYTLRYSYNPVNVLEQISVDYSWMKYISCYRTILFLQTSLEFISKQDVCQLTLTVA